PANRSGEISERIEGPDACSVGAVLKVSHGPENALRLPSGMALVQLAQVGKVYRSLQGSDYVAVRDFSLDIEAGEFFCLLGTSSCGKTTVLNMVAGFVAPTSGRIDMSRGALEGTGAEM